MRINGRILALVAVVGCLSATPFRGVDWALRRAVRGSSSAIIVFRRVTLREICRMLSGEFGLILLFHTIDPGRLGFFASLRVSGLRLNLFAVLIVIIGGPARHP